ncbi:MAG: flippase-like domain-containing protein [Nanoarchaeota archaeon]|nr:flippase-like domain-containing protein [Nanoarchaeota archaeon]
MRLKKSLKYLIFFFPTILIFVLLLYFSDLGKIGDTLMRIPFWAYFVIIVISAFSWVIRGERWKVFLHLNKIKIKIIPATALAVFGNFANWVVPARIGDLAWAYIAKRVLKTRLHITLITIILNRFLDFLSLIILLQLAFFFVGKELLIGWAKALNIISIIILILFIIVIKILLTEKLILKLTKGPLKKFKKHYLIIKESLLGSTKSKKTFFKWIFMSVVIWLIEALITYILFISLGININFFFIILAVIMANLTKILGITPGGIGTYEAAMALTIVALTSLDYSVVLTISILDALLKKLFILIVGVITTNYYGIKLFSFNNKKDNN